MPGKRTSPPKKLCVCCQQLVSHSTEFRHRMLQAPPRIKALSPYQIRGELPKRAYRNTPGINAPDVIAFAAGDNDHNPVANDSDPAKSVTVGTEAQMSNIVRTAMSNAIRD